MSGPPPQRDVKPKDSSLVSKASSSSSLPESAQQQQTQPKKESSSPLLDIPKKKRASLLTTALGASQKRADVAVKSLQGLLETKKGDAAESNKDPKPSQSQQEPMTLPSGKLIMKAMAMLEVKIKATEKERTEVECKLATAREEKVREDELKAEKELEEEEEEEKQFLLERRQEREQEHEEKMKLWYEQKVRIREEEQKQAQEVLSQEIQKAQETEAKRLESGIEEQVHSASEQINKDIAKVRREHDKATQAASKSQAKVEAVQEEYLASVKKIADKEESDKVAGKRAQRPTVKASDLVKSILAENQRKAAEGHLMATSLAIASKRSDDSISPHAVTEDWKDPKFHRSSAEWALKIASVTGPANALYTEPTEAPFFQLHDTMYKQMAPLVKEYILDKKRKLDSYKSDLAEEYDYRKRKYNKHLMMQRRRKSSNNSSRASLSVSRQSILGGKTASEGSSNNASSAAVSAANVLGGRTSSNPYRRPRRGNDVRSEYEQEQIIAELAAKEAMEKRIAYGGCKPTNQISPFEHVRLCVTVVLLV